MKKKTLDTLKDLRSGYRYPALIGASDEEKELMDVLRRLKNLKVLNFNGNVRGLRLRALFLAASNSSSKETRAGHSCYNDALYDALEADIIDIETFKKQLIKPTFNKN